MTFPAVFLYNRKIYLFSGQAYKNVSIRQKGWNNTEKTMYLLLISGLRCDYNKDSNEMF